MRRWMGSGRCQRRELGLHTRRRNVAASILYVKSSSVIQNMSVGRWRRTKTWRQNATNRPRYPRPPTTSVGNTARMGGHRRRPGRARNQTRCRADTSRRPRDCCLRRRTLQMAQAYLVSMLTPLAPVDIRQHPRRAPLCPSGRLHGDGASCPGGPDSLRRGLGDKARQVGARMSAHVPMQLCRGGRVGRTNRNVEESEA
jgi:hypothetical protein